MTSSIKSFAKSQLTATTSSGARIRHDVYRKGSGPAVVIIQELPGIGPQTLKLADEFVEKGFEVFLPHLFGPIGRISLAGNLARVFCMRKEFHLFSTNKSSPIVDWLKALCRHICDQRSLPGVGVIGMCLTGNFAISLMADASVLAAVAAQPAMPFLQQGSLHMSEQEIAEVKIGIDSTAPMKAYRFKQDWMSTAEKFHCINEKLNTDGKTRVELKTLPGKAHSVLTLDFVDEQDHPTRHALDEILEYFSTQLSNNG